MRITIDLDSPSRLEILQAWHGLRDYGDPVGRISSSGRGVHLKIHGFTGSWDECLRIRSQLGDDPKRIEFDMYSVGKPRQILFQRKGTGTVGEWIDAVEVLLQRYDNKT